MQDRLTKIEEQLAFLERHVETLDEIVRETRDRVDRMQGELTGLRGSVRDVHDAIRFPAADAGSGEPETSGPGDDTPG